ncbi:MAG TPA: class I SAM-dependent methyltransferase [Bordetella sp.]
MSLYNRILGHPIIYNKIRPLIVGGIDLSNLYESLDVSAQDVVVDVGCGTGDALNYLKSFKEYLGFDVDEVATSYASKRFASVANASFHARLFQTEDVEKIQPTRVVLAGLLHHLTDEQAMDLLSMLAKSPRLRRIVSLDIVYLPGEWVSNAFAWCDRGRYCRKQRGYEALAANAGLNVTKSIIMKSHPTHGRVKYLAMSMEPN